MGRGEQTEKDRENEERALVLRQQRAGETERRQRECPTFVRDDPAAGRTYADAEHERERDIRVGREQLVEHGRSQREAEERQPEDERRNTVAQQREERQQRRDEEEEELHVQEACVKRSHSAKVHRLERRKQQRVVEIGEPVGRAGEHDRVGPPEGIKRMTFERPDRPRVVAIQRCDPEGAAVVDHQRDESGETGCVDPIRPAPPWAFGAVEAPRAEPERQSGQ